MKKVICLVDGLNLYYPIKATGRGYLKWLNLNLLVAEWLKSNEELVEIRYYNAPPLVHKPSSARLKNYNNYVSLLENDGIVVVAGKHKFRETTLSAKAGTWVPVLIDGKKHNAVLSKDTRISGITREEKMTDVNMATDLVGLAYRNRYDHAILISGDSDLFPAVNELGNYHKKKVSLVTTGSIVGGERNRSIAGMRTFVKKKQRDGMDAQLICLTRKDLEKAKYPKIVKVNGKYFTRPKDWN